jgi:hypothetical protein
VKHEIAAVTSLNNIDHDLWRGRGRMPVNTSTLLLDHGSQNYVLMA